MPRDLLRSAQGTRPWTAFWAARLGLAVLGVASAGLLMRLAVPLSQDLLLSTLPSFCTAVRGYLVPPYIFVVVNFMIFVILKLPVTKNHHLHRKEPPGGAAAAVAAAADPPKPLKDLPHSSPREVSPNVWSDAAPFVSPPASSPKAGHSSPSAWSDESSLTTDFEDDSAASPPAAPAVFAQSTAETGVRPSDEPPATGAVEDEEDDHDSLDATWKAITGGEAGRRQLKKNETWSAPPRVHPEPAWGGPALKSKTFRQSPSPATRANWREAPMADDHEDINRQFEAFIKKGKDQMRLQREESAAQRYMEMVNSPGY